MTDNKTKDLFSFEGISHFCFNKDFTKCALSKKNNIIYIYQVKSLNNPNEWVELQQLKNHDLYISGLDWNPENDLLISCSYDKTLKIWKFNGESWKSSSLESMVKMSYLFCNWSKKGNKFVAGSSDKKCLICFDSAEKGMWTGRQIKGHKSSVVSARIDPSSLYVVVGSTDMKVEVSSCYLPDIDDPHLPSNIDKKSIPKFDTKLYSIECNSWANSVCWNLSGTCCYASDQKANLYVIDPTAKSHETIPLNHSAITAIVPVGENGIICATYARELLKYEKDGEKWVLKKKVSDDSSVSQHSKGIELYGAGIKEKLNNFNTGVSGIKKKASLVFQTEENTHVHASNISSMTIKDDLLITTDLAGFYKMWKI